MSERRIRALLEGIEITRCLGVELGPLDRPAVSKSDGKVIYVDHLPTERLQEVYKYDSNVDCDAIQVDIALGNKRLTDFFRGDFLADYVVASHVIEHVPDLIGWLEQLRSIIRETGELRLAIPDRRFTFDYLRRTTTVADVVAAYLQKAKAPQPREVFDFVHNTVTLDLHAAWRGEIVRQNLVTTQRQHALPMARDVADHNLCQEIHCWVFTPTSFALLMAEIAQLSLLEFRCSRFMDTQRNTLEFIISMRPCDDLKIITESWKEVASIAHHHDPESASITPQRLRPEDETACLMD